MPMHAERDIVLPILSVCLSVRLSNAGSTVLKRMDTFDALVYGHHSRFF